MPDSDRSTPPEQSQAAEDIARRMDDAAQAHAFVASVKLAQSAPLLLRTLKDVLAYWNETGFSECDADCDCIVQDVQAAIAAAEGE